MTAREDPTTQVPTGGPVVTVEPPPSADVRAPAESAAWTGQTGTPTRLLLLRHGETELSVQRRYSGRGDPELTARGHDQAEAAAVVDALGVPLEVCEALTETDFGGWEGLTFAEAAERDPQLHARWLGDEHVPPPGGESFADVGARVAAERAAILAAYPGETVVVVTHVTPLKMMLRAALAGGPEILYRLHLDLASLSVADFYPDGGASVRLFNDTGHLPRR